MHGADLLADVPLWSVLAVHANEGGLAGSQAKCTQTAGEVESAVMIKR